MVFMSEKIFRDHGFLYKNMPIHGFLHLESRFMTVTSPCKPSKPTEVPGFYTLPENGRKIRLLAPKWGIFWHIFQGKELDVSFGQCKLQSTHGPSVSLAKKNCSVCQESPGFTTPYDHLTRDGMFKKLCLEIIYGSKASKVKYVKRVKGRNFTNQRQFREAQNQVQRGLVLNSPVFPHYISI